LGAAGTGFAETFAGDGAGAAVVRSALGQLRSALHQRAHLADAAALTCEGRLLAEVIAARLLDHEPVSGAGDLQEAVTIAILVTDQLAFTGGGARTAAHRRHRRRRAHQATRLATGSRRAARGRLAC
jgi:hypothetical protein